MTHLGDINNHILLSITSNKEGGRDTTFCLLYFLHITGLEIIIFVFVCRDSKTFFPMMIAIFSLLVGD